VFGTPVARRVWPVCIRNADRLYLAFVDCCTATKRPYCTTGPRRASVQSTSPTEYGGQGKVVAHAKEAVQSRRIAVRHPASMIGPLGGCLGFWHAQKQGRRRENRNPGRGGATPAVSRTPGGKRSGRRRSHRGLVLDQQAKPVDPILAQLQSDRVVVEGRDCRTATEALWTRKRIFAFAWTSR